ncbi:MAG: hypothetical protein MJ237_04525 [bacterium]|nr:hypothetical protein [bacterium]
MLMSMNTSMSMNSAGVNVYQSFHNKYWCGNVDFGNSPRYMQYPLDIIGHGPMPPVQAVKENWFKRLLRMSFYY